MRLPSFADYVNQKSVDFPFSLIHLELDQPPDMDDTELCDEGASMENTEEDDEEAVDADEGL